MAVILTASDIGMYSLYQQLKAKVTGEEHRLERLQGVVDDLLQLDRNAEKMEKIETQVTKIETQVTDMSDTLQEQDDAQVLIIETPKKKRR